MAIEPSFLGATDTSPARGTSSMPAPDIGYDHSVEVAPASSFLAKAAQLRVNPPTAERDTGTVTL